MTPRPQPELLPKQQPDSAEPPHVPLATRLKSALAFVSKYSERVVDLAWLARARDLLLLLGLALIIHAIHFWSATAAEFAAGVMLLWLSWSMSPAPTAPPAHSASPPTRPGGRT